MRHFLARASVALASAVWLGQGAAGGQGPSPLAGVWSLNRPLSEFPKEFGFSPNGLPPPEEGETPSRGGGRGGRGSSGSGRSQNPFFGRPESYDEGRRRQLLMGEIRNPPARLMIVDVPAAITITNELGQSRTLHPTGRDEPVEIEGVPFTVVTRRDGDKLVVVYHVEQGRDVRYTYTPSPSRPRLSVEVQLLEKDTGDRVTRVYDAGTTADEPVAAEKPGAAPAAVRQAPATPPTSAGQTTPGSFDQRPGAEFKGLKAVGVLVEDFGAEAVACGLNHVAIEDALAKRLAAGGLIVRRNSDEDTYVYVNVITTSAPGAACVSRYDAFLYTHATAKLTYHEQPVLAQVSLIHRGGIGASTAAGHAAAVSRGLENYIDVFLTQIRDANR